jgi:hypothetical protein
LVNVHSTTKNMRQFTSCVNPKPFFSLCLLWLQQNKWFVSVSHHFIWAHNQSTSSSGQQQPASPKLVFVSFVLDKKKKLIKLTPPNTKTDNSGRLLILKMWPLLAPSNPKNTCTLKADGVKIWLPLVTWNMAISSRRHGAAHLRRNVVG